MSSESVHFLKNSYGAEKNLSKFFQKELIKIKYLELFECEENNVVFSIILSDAHNKIKEYEFELNSMDLKILSIDLFVNTSEFCFSITPYVKNKHFSEVTSKITYNLYFEKLGMNTKSPKYPLNFDDVKKLEYI